MVIYAFPPYVCTQLHFGPSSFIHRRPSASSLGNSNEHKLCFRLTLSTLSAVHLALSLPSYSSRISNVSLSLARSARSTPTRILDAFHNCTMLMMFLATHTGAVNTANNCGYVV